MKASPPLINYSENNQIKLNPPLLIIIQVKAEQTFKIFIPKNNFSQHKKPVEWTLLQLSRYKKVNTVKVKSNKYSEFFRFSFSFFIFATSWCNYHKSNSSMNQTPKNVQKKQPKIKEQLQNQWSANRLNKW